VRREMGRWEGVMTRLREKLICDLSLNPEEERFALDCHDLSLENIFVSSEDHTVMTCIIDWEATTTRPLWAAAHLPSFLRSSVFVARVFRSVVEELESLQSADEGVGGGGGELNRKWQEIEKWIPESYVSSLPSASSATTTTKLSSLAREWLSYESSGAPLRLAHRCVEWDGWEEGLVDSILGPEPEPESEHVGEPEGEGGPANPNSDPSDGLVWGWCVHGHGHGHGHGEEEMASTSSISRPPFLRSNSSYGAPSGHLGGAGHQVRPLFPLVPLQTGTVNGIGNGKEREKDGLTNGIIPLQPTHSINNAKKLNGNEPGGFNAAPLNSSPTNNNPFSKGIPQIANANANKNNNNNNNKKALKPAPTASTQTALLLSTQTEQAEKAMEKMLVGTGDICGGRGGELGRRLEAWLVRSGNLGGSGGGGGGPKEG